MLGYPSLIILPLVYSNILIVGRENHFRPGDGIAVYIDAARYLPENVGPTKVVFRVLTQSKKVSRGADNQTKLDLEDALCNPEYKV